jgi:hypothetical protein
MRRCFNPPLIFARVEGSLRCGGKVVNFARAAPDFGEFACGVYGGPEGEMKGGLARRAKRE